LVILGLMCLFASLAALYLKTYQSVLTLIAISTGYVVFSLQYFTLKGVFTEVVRPEAGLFFSYLGAMIYKYVAEEKDKRFIKNAFSFFVDREIIKEILEDPSRLKLGGERRELTVLFCDIRDFTAMSERMRPEDLSTFLNVHLTEMTNIIFHNGGLLDKYIGDAVVALFGVPVAKEDHAVRGAQTAIDMVRAVKRIRTQFWGTPMENLRVGVGVNSGIASVGNMGSEFRFEYTAIGDEMNLGARLEGLNKYYGTTIIISASTAQKLGEDFIFRELDFVQVKGKSEPVGIYELLDPEDNFPLPLIKIYQQGLIAYCSQNWDIAEENFKTVLNELPKDKPSILMLEKIAHYRYHPPAANWRGVSVLEHK
jgi:adenylate cyclase